MGFFDKLREMIPQVELPDRDLLDRPNLRREVVEGILKLKQRGRRGVEALPPAVTVAVTVAEGSTGVVRRFLDDPAFDTEIEAELLNRLVGARAEALPVRAYVVQTGPRSSVAVSESDAGVIGWIEVIDGDAAGRVISLSASRAEHRLGRGEWHGDGGVPNDIIVASQEARFVSRRAAVIERIGSGVMIRTLDQGECLVVIRTSGRRIRPINTRAQRVKLEPGDRIELTDGSTQRVTLQFRATPPEEE
jgi:hypothetical protein